MAETATPKQNKRGEKCRSCGKFKAFRKRLAAYRDRVTCEACTISYDDWDHDSLSKKGLPDPPQPPRVVPKHRDPNESDTGLDLGGE